MSQNTLASLSGVRKRFGKLQALDGFDLAVKRGELLAVLGPNGAGKSTAISILLGLQTADEGSAELFGHAPQEIDGRRRIGVMMQEVMLPGVMRPRELLEQVASYYPVPYDVDAVIARMSLEGLLKRPYGKLSGGQKRQVQFALAICGRPELLFLDEPTVGLDVQAREALWKVVRELMHEGCSIVLTTHYLEEAEALADRVAVMARGRLITTGSVNEIRAHVSRKQVSCVSRLTPDTVRAWPEVGAGRDGARPSADQHARGRSACSCGCSGRIRSFPTSRSNAPASPKPLPNSPMNPGGPHELREHACWAPVGRLLRRDALRIHQVAAHARIRCADAVLPDHVLPAVRRLPRKHARQQRHVAVHLRHLRRLRRHGPGPVRLRGVARHRTRTGLAAAQAGIAAAARRLSTGARRHGDAVRRDHFPDAHAHGGADRRRAADLLAGPAPVRDRRARRAAVLRHRHVRRLAGIRARVAGHREPDLPAHGLPLGTLAAAAVHAQVPGRYRAHLARLSSGADGARHGRRAERGHHRWSHRGARRHHARCSSCSRCVACMAADSDC